MTLEDLLTARAARFAALRPPHLEAATLASWVGGLGFATLPQLEESLEQAGLSSAILVGRWMEEALQTQAVIELWCWPGIQRYCAADLAGYVYVAVGDRHWRRDYKLQARRRQLSWLAAEVFEQLLACGEPQSSAQLRDRMGAERTSAPTIEHALQELAKTLKVLRRGRVSGEARWQTVASALPGVPACVDQISQSQAAAALLTRCLDAMVAASEQELAEFFSPLFSRTRIHEALTGLDAVREIVPETIAGRPSWRLKE